MNLQEASARAAELRRLIEKANHDYYDLAAPTVGDRDYDLWEAELLRIEGEFPSLADASSPVRNVAGGVSDGFAKVRHDPPMQSLDKTHAKDELAEFDAFVRKTVTDFTYVVEPKVDGVSISLRYEDGRLVRAATRGNGTIGDDITANALAIAAVPRELPASAPRVLEVRGEAYMTRSGFLELNERQAAAGLEEFANPRNACAGSLKQLDARVTASRPLDLVVYNSGGAGCDGFASHSEMIAAFRGWGFPTAPWSRRAKTIEEVFAAIDELQERRHDFPFEIDGAVVKIDERALYPVLGATAHGPRWARAYKYAPERAETVVESITVQVGRTGILTPVAELRPVELAGSTIARATLHNEDQIARQDIRIGDHVWIVKAGDVIPAVDSVIVEKRTGAERKFEMPAKCPVCGGETKRADGEVAVRCVNPACGAQLRRRLEHFASRNALDLKALGEKVADALVSSGMVKDRLQYLNDLLAEDHRGLPLRNLICGLWDRVLKPYFDASDDMLLDDYLSASQQYAGLEEMLNRIRKMEKQIADIAAEHERFSALAGSAVLKNVVENDAKKGKERLILPIKVEAAKAVLAFFESEYGRRFAERMAALGIDPVSEKTAPAKTTGPLAGMGCVLTGTLSRPRGEYAKLIEAAGGIVQSAVTSKTRYLIAGENTGATKTAKARALGTEVIDEKRLLELLG